MRIEFPRRKVSHKRIQIHPPICTQKPFFGTKGHVLTYKEAVDIYYKVQDFLDRWDVETEIDYREEEGEFTTAEAAEARARMKAIIDEYRGRLDDDWHWNEVLMGAINWIFGR